MSGEANRLEKLNADKHRPKSNWSPLYRFKYCNAVGRITPLKQFQTKDNHQSFESFESIQQQKSTIFDTGEKVKQKYEKKR